MREKLRWRGRLNSVAIRDLRDYINSFIVLSNLLTHAMLCLTISAGRFL